MIIMKSILGDSNFSLVGGKVAKVTEGTGKAEGRLVSVELNDGLKIAFWDSENKKLASRVKMAKVKEGSYITVLGNLKDEKTMNAVNFRYSGVWKFSQANMEPTYCGVITNIAVEDGVYSITMDNDEVYTIRNKGTFRLAEFFESKNASVGDEFAFIANESKDCTNLCYNSEWYNVPSINALMGTVSFIDEGTSAYGSYVRVNVSIYNGAEKGFEKVYVYFDEPQIIDSIKQNLKPRTPSAFVGRMSKENTLKGYYYIVL